MECEAEQHQGEPVAYVDHSASGGVRWRPGELGKCCDGMRLYTRPGAQPAAAVVVLPERMPTGNNVEGEHNRLSPGVREGWNRCLDEVVRLNPPQQ